MTTHCKILFSISYFFKLIIKPKLDIVPKANWKKVGDWQPKNYDIKQRAKLIQFGVNGKGCIFFLEIKLSLVKILPSPNYQLT